MSPSPNAKRSSKLRISSTGVEKSWDDADEAFPEGQAVPFRGVAAADDPGALAVGEQGLPQPQLPGRTRRRPPLPGAGGRHPPVSTGARRGARNQRNQVPKGLMMGDVAGAVYKEDAALTRAAQAGEVAALGLLLERHRAGMRAVAVSILGPGADADDVMQEAALTALLRIGDVREPAAVGAWLRMVVRNAARLVQRESAAVRPVSELPLPSAHLGPEQWLERNALRDWVWEALAELSPGPAHAAGTALLRHRDHLLRTDRGGLRHTGRHGPQPPQPGPGQTGNRPRRHGGCPARRCRATAPRQPGRGPRTAGRRGAGPPRGAAPGPVPEGPGAAPSARATAQRAGGKGQLMV